MIYIESKRKKLETLRFLYPGAAFIDVTSRAPEPWVRFSPFYPHGEIPIPYTHDQFAQSVEGVWQGLKVFAKEDIDVSRFEITSMRGIKRTTRRLGAVSGHRKGTQGGELLDYLRARQLIYIPTYRWVLANKLQQEVEGLQELHTGGDLVFLDYDTNGDPYNLKRPLSHASLIRSWLSEGVA